MATLYDELEAFNAAWLAFCMAIANTYLAPILNALTRLIEWVTEVLGRG